MATRVGLNPLEPSGVLEDSTSGYGIRNYVTVIGCCLLEALVIQGDYRALSG